MRRPGIRALIIALAIASILPGLLAGGLILLETERAEERHVETLILETVRAFSLAFDGQVHEIQEELATLGRSDALQAGDLASFSRAAADQVRRAQGSWIRLLDKTGRGLVDTRLPADTVPPARDEVETASEAAATDRPAISNVFVPASGARRMVAIDVPVDAQGALRWILEMAVPTQHFEEVLEQGNLPPRWVAVLIDRNGTFVARFPPSETSSEGRPSSIIDTMRRVGEAGYSHVDFEGVPLSGAFTRSKSTGWSVAVGVATEAIEAPFRRALAILAAVSVAMTLTGVVIAWRIARRIARPVASLARAAEALGCGPSLTAQAGGFREIERIAAGLTDAVELAKRRSVERDKALAALHAANENLEERVRERTSDLVESARRLSEEVEHRREAEEALGQKRRMEAIGQLTAGIAHDFNNLLTAVIGNLELLQSRAGEERTRRLATGALNAAARGAGLTKQLLAFGRRQRLERRVVDLNELVADALPLLRQAAGPLVELETIFAGGEWAVAIDPAQMTAALVNLAANGRDAMPEGGRLTIETRHLTVTGDDPQVGPGEWGQIIVRDTGSGMPPEVSERAFEPFFTTKPAGAGSGLGLSMVYGLVKQLDGEIAIASEPGQGTAVTIYLPRAGDAAGSAAAVPSEAAPSVEIAGTRLLLVDDDPEVLSMMAAALSEAGCEVTRASSGSTAIDLFGGGDAFDLAVIDYAMPGMSGTATARALRARRLDLPVLLVTGFAEALKPSEWPAEDILHKPFEPAVLRQRVRAIVNRAGNPAG